MPLTVSTQGARQLKELSARIKEAGDSGMRKKFRRNVREAGAPCVADLRAAVMGVKVTRGDDPYARGSGRVGTVGQRRSRSTGLRARVAASVGVSQTRKGIRIRASEKRIGPYGKSLPRYLDGTLRGYKNWRHPVYGNTNVWVTQHGEPWFFVTIQRHRASFRKAVFDMMEETAKELSR